MQADRSAPKLAGMSDQRAAQLLTPSEAARLLGISADSVRRLSNNGELPTVKTTGGFRVFKRADVERLAHQRAARVAKK
jgi:excisionase family DNA binding protein